MAWIKYKGSPVLYGVTGSLMTKANPPAVRVPASNLQWVPAVNPYATNRAMAPYIGSEVAFRGDTRDPETIEKAGGLWAHRAQAVGMGGQREQRSPDRHQAGPGNTIYVSCTRDLSVAKGFAYTGYVYVFRIDAGVDYNRYADGNAYQAEVMAVQGVSLRNIIAVRRLQQRDVLTNTLFVPAGMTGEQILRAIRALLD